MSVNVGSLAFDRQQLRRWLPGSGDASVDLLWILLALTLVRGVIYAVLNPPFGSPDERPHFDYVANLATAGVSGPRGDEGHQPIPYYALMVPAYWLTAGHSPAVQDLAVRLSSLPLLLAMVTFSWLSARKMAPDKPVVPLIATTIVALEPENSVIAASANNDTAANLMGAILTYLLVSLLVSPTRWSIPLVLVGLVASLFTKGQTLPIALLLGLLVLAQTSRRVIHTKSLGLILGVVVAAICMGLALTTPEGHQLVTRSQAKLSVLAYWPLLIDTARSTGFGPFSYQMVSYWSAFLGESVHPAIPWYLGPVAITVLGSVGYIVHITSHFKAPLPRLRSALLLRATLVLMILGVWSMSYLYFLSISNPALQVSDGWILQTMHGRYLLATLVPLSLLVAEGWNLLIPETWKKQAAIAILVVFVAFDLSSVVALMSHYAWV